MKRNTISIVAPYAGAFALLMASAIPLSADTLRFTQEKVRQGSERVEVSRMTMNLKLEVVVGGAVQGTFQQTESEMSRKLEKVIAVKDGITTSMRVTYQKAEKVKKSPGKTDTIANAVQGKTYVVKAASGGTMVAYGDGKIPGAKEVARVRKDYRGLGRRDRMEENLVGRELKSGQRAPFLESSLRSYMAGSKAEEIRELKIVFKGSRDCRGVKCGVFDVVMVMGAKVDKTMDMSITLKGEILVRARGAWPVKINLKGPVSLSGSSMTDGRKMEMRGGGDMEMSIEYIHK